MFPWHSSLGQNIFYITLVCLNDPREAAAKCILIMTNTFLIAFIDVSRHQAHISFIFESEGFSRLKYDITLNRNFFSNHLITVN